MYALVIDDSRAIRSIIGRALRELGYQLIEASNGRDALDLLATAEAIPDIALVDWNMPIMDGCEFVTRVRQVPRYERMRLLMVTTENEIERMQAALAAGADEYLMKPFTREALSDKLQLLGLVNSPESSVGS